MGRDFFDVIGTAVDHVIASTLSSVFAHQYNQSAAKVPVSLNSSV